MFTHFFSLFYTLVSGLSNINLFIILLQNLPDNFSDCKLKKKGLVKKVQVSLELLLGICMVMLCAIC